MTDPAAPNAAAPDPAAPMTAGRSGARRTLLLIAALCIAPVVASYVAYYFFPRESQVNYGTLLPTAPAPPIEGERLDGAPFRLAELAGRWLLVANGGGSCDAICQQTLYGTRQARTMQGAEQDRIVRVWLVTDAAVPRPALLGDHPGLVVARVAAARVAALPGGPNAIVVIDPLGNLVLRYGENPDIKGLGRDLTRLLKASRIG